jgi:hypothetical protein
VSAMDAQVRRQILERRVALLQSHLDLLKEQEYAGSTAGAERELSKAESELQALGQREEQPHRS